MPAFLADDDHPMAVENGQPLRPEEAQGDSPQRPETRAGPSRPREDSQECLDYTFEIEKLNACLCNKIPNDYYCYS